MAVFALAPLLATLDKRFSPMKQMYHIRHPISGDHRHTTRRKPVHSHQKRSCQS